MRRLGATLILLGLGGFVLPLFGVQFRLVTAAQESLGDLGQYASLFLAGVGFVILFSAEFFSQLVQRPNSAKFLEIQSDSLIQAIPSREEISNAGVPKLTQEAIVALYPYVDQIAIARAAGELYMKIAARFSTKAAVTDLDVQYFLWALDLIDQGRRKTTDAGSERADSSGDHVA